MKITLSYFGGSRQQIGTTQEEVELPVGATVADLQAHIVARHTALAGFVPSCRWAVNLEFASPDLELHEGAEVALIPPVAGGAPRGVLTKDPLDPNWAVDRVQNNGAGATVVFVGHVRDHHRGKTVNRLDYEAYEPMAQRQLEQIATSLSDSAQQVDVAIEHRIGSLAVGESSVVIAVSSPHREEAFTVCRQALEAIKDDVTIWKKEHTAEGATWTGWGGG